MHADIISPDVLSSSPNLPSSLLPGMCSTFNLVLMWLCLFFFIFKLYIIVFVLPNIKMNPPQWLLPVHEPAFSGTLPTVTNEWQVNEQGGGAWRL